MSDGVLTAAQHSLDYVQTPIDDLYSFYYTMQWAAVFHDQEFAAKDIPIELKLLRDSLLGTQNDRFFTTNRITDMDPPLQSHEYGSFLAKCQPLLRAWYFELQGIRADWRGCQAELKGQETKAEIYIPLFLTFAGRGVAKLAELVHVCTENMD